MVQKTGKYKGAVGIRLPWTQESVIHLQRAGEQRPLPRVQGTIKVMRREAPLGDAERREGVSFATRGGGRKTDRQTDILSTPSHIVTTFASTVKYDFKTLMRRKVSQINPWFSQSDALRSFLRFQALFCYNFFLFRELPFTALEGRGGGAATRSRALRMALFLLPSAPAGLRRKTELNHFLLPPPSLHCPAPQNVTVFGDGAFKGVVKATGDHP